MILAARVKEILSLLRAAGDNWPAAARALPEFSRFARERPPYRAWVLLDGQHEQHDTLLRLCRDASGVWFEPGTYIHQIEKEAHRGQA